MERRTNDNDQAKRKLQNFMGRSEDLKNINGPRDRFQLNFSELL